MSSIVLSRVLVCAALALVSTAVLSRESQPTLSCETAKVERSALRQAPKGARRVETHVLKVITANGAKRFVDKPPYEELGGLRWRYCGYDSRTKAHLIERMDEDLYSGDLLFDETGRLMHAGHTVLFSPDDKEFLAIEQEDGVDGENWTVYDVDGKAKWTGYAGTILKVRGIKGVTSTFDHPQWNTQGELTARFVCADSKVHGVVTLTRSPSGKLSWHDHINCP